MLNRSEFVRVAVAAAALGPVLLPTAASASSEHAGAHTLAIASDPHYISPRLTDNGPAFTAVVSAGDGKVMLHSEDVLDAFVAQLLAERPEVLLITGDLTFNGARLSHEDLAAKLMALIDSGIRVVVLPGNHDIAYPYAACFSGDSYTYVDSVSPAEFRTIWYRFGYQEAILEDPFSLSYVYPLFDDTWLLLVDCNAAQDPGRLAPQTLSFCRDALAQASEQGVRVISASHQNLLQHCALFRDGFVMGACDDLRDLYRRFGVRLNLSGHIHVQHTAVQGTLFEAATSSLAVTPCQYTRVALHADGLFEAQTVPVDVSTWAYKLGRTDADLLDFSAYADRFFDACTRVQPYDELVAAGLTSNEAAATTQAIQRMNRHYFAGRTDRINWDDPALAAAFGKTSIEAYLQVVHAEDPCDHTSYSVMV